MPPTVLTSGLGSWGRWCLGRTRTPTAGKEGGPMQHEGNHVNFESYFQLGRAETAGWWSFPPFLRVWSMCKSEPGLHISSFLPQNSLEKSSCCSPAREDLACHLSLPDSQSPPPLFSHTDFALPSCKGQAAHLREVLAHPGSWIPTGWLSSSPILREGHPWGVLAS